MKVVFRALFAALGTTLACWRVVLLLWILNAVVGWLVVAPLATAIEDTFLHNSVSTTLLSIFDNEVWVDFQNVSSDSVESTRRGSAAAGLPWMVLWWLLSAGVLLRASGRVDFPGFLAACARFAHRFVWLLLLTGLALGGVAWINGRVSRLATSLFTDFWDYDAGAGTLGWTMTLKTLLMLGLVGVVVHTGRIARLRTVRLNERFMPRTWLRALVTMARRAPQVFVAGTLSMLPLVLIFAAYEHATTGLFTGGVLSGDHVSWRYLLIAQATQLLIQAALVYRFAVDAKMWPLFAPPEPAPVAAAPATPAPAETSTLEPAPEPAPESTPEATQDGEVDKPNGGAKPFGALLLAAALVLGAAVQEAPPPEDTEPAPQQAPPAPTPPQDTPPVAPFSGPAVMQPLSVRRGDYVMAVTIDSTDHTATVREHATFLNTTSQPVETLWMHLYPAAFANTHSTWMLEGDPKAVTRRGEELGGYINVQSVRVDAPTGGEVTIDDTLMRIDLGTPVPPGGRVSVDIDFVTRFPNRIARMGTAGEHIDGMQWYPKFCVHTENGWVLNQFHRRGEFFSDFGTYDVTLTYPEHLELEATGLPGNITVAEGMKTVRYRAADVHDFAFCADPNVIRIEDRFIFLSPERREIEIVYLCQPYALPKADLVMDTVKRCLEYSGTYWMQYPYDRLVLDGLPHNMGGGMEYPMLFTVSQRFPNHLGWLVDNTEDPVSLTAHEFGHQYWYGILASNEYDEAWLDEGINTWGTVKTLEYIWPDKGQTDALTFIQRSMLRSFFQGNLRADLYITERPWSLANLVGWDVSPFHDTPPDPARSDPTLLGWRVPGVDRWRLPDMSANRMAWEKGSYYEDASVLPLTTPSREFIRGYSPLIYNKSALILATLENHIGFDAMQQLIRAYVEEWKFRHPTSDDFLAVVSRETDGKYDGWMRQMITTDRTLDFAVESVSTRRDPGPVGFSQQSRPGDPVRWEGSDGSPDEVEQTPPIDRLVKRLFGREPAPDADSGAAWASRYVIRQLGDIVAPVTIQARFADGTTERFEWNGRGGQLVKEHHSNGPLIEVVVDPERRYAIDLDRNNNGWRRTPARTTVRTLRFISHFWSQTGLDTWSIFF